MYSAFIMSSAGDEWPSGSYGFPRPRSGCPGGEKDGWYEGWRYQDMEDADKRVPVAGQEHPVERIWMSNLLEIKEM